MKVLDMSLGDVAYALRGYCEVVAYVPPPQDRPALNRAISAGRLPRAPVLGDVSEAPRKFDMLGVSAPKTGADSARIARFVGASRPRYVFGAGTALVPLLAPLGYDSRWVTMGRRRLCLSVLRGAPRSRLAACRVRRDTVHAVARVSAGGGLAVSPDVARAAFAVLFTGAASCDAFAVAPLDPGTPVPLGPLGSDESQGMTLGDRRFRISLIPATTAATATATTTTTTTTTTARAPAAAVAAAAPAELLPAGDVTGAPSVSASVPAPRKRPSPRPARTTTPAARVS